VNPSTLPTDLEIRIRPNTRWFHLDIAGLRHYSDLLWLLVKRDFTSKYKQTILGPLWFLLNPVIQSLMMTIVFGKIVGVGTDGAPAMLFYLSGMLSWGYFSTVLGSTSNSLAGNTHLFAKVYFPRLIPPLATTASSLLSLLIQLAVFLVFFLQHQTSAPPEQLLRTDPVLWLFFPLIVLHMALLALGAGLILSAISAKYRDVQQIQGYLITMIMYATPIIYPLSRIPEQWQWVAAINPLTALTESTRYLFLGVGTLSLNNYLTSIGVTLLLFFVGVFAYQRSARTFVDTV
jgi:lipopolysaccharide transport system permease protein